MTLHGKVALVTGASRGIGRTIAEHLARNGVSVVVNYYPTEWEDAEDTVRGIKQEGGTAIAVAGDVADAAHVRSLFDIADEQFGRPDIVVLNAADVRHAAVVDTSEDLFDAIFAANARGAFLTLRESAVRLRDGGRIVAISAGLSIIPREGTAVYAASKAAVNHLVRVLAREVGPRGITVNSVLPGPTRSCSSSPRSTASAWWNCCACAEAVASQPWSRCMTKARLSRRCWPARRSSVSWSSSAGRSISPMPSCSSA